MPGKFVRTNSNVGDLITSAGLLGNSLKVSSCQYCHPKLPVSNCLYACCSVKKAKVKLRQVSLTLQEGQVLSYSAASSLSQVKKWSTVRTAGPKSPAQAQQNHQYLQRYLPGQVQERKRRLSQAGRSGGALRLSSRLRIPRKA